jgi:hypothetical protein
MVNRRHGPTFGRSRVKLGSPRRSNPFPNGTSTVQSNHPTTC